MGRGRKGSGVEPLKSCIRVRIYRQGERRTVTLDLKPTVANIRATERLMARVRQEIELGIFDFAATFPDAETRDQDAVSITGFATFARRWLNSMVLEKSTYSDYRGAIENLWIPKFGEAPLDAIKPSQIREVNIARLATVCPKTVNHNLIPLRGIFNAALDDELIERSPMANVRNLKFQKARPDPFDREEMETIIGFMADRYPEQVANFYEFAFGTGMRPSEEIAMAWGDIDWKRQSVRIRRARVRHVIKSTKTNRERDIDLTDRMIAVLKRQKAHSFMRGLDTPVFLNPASGTPWPDVQDQRKLYFHPALKRLGLRSRDAYQTRHTYATLALMSGVNPAYISRQLGHTTTAMLFSTYSRWIDGGDDGREARKMNAAFSRPESEFAHISPTAERRSISQRAGAAIDFNGLEQVSTAPAQLSLVTPTGIEPVFSP